MNPQSTSKRVSLAPPLAWERLDWAALDRLRARFLAGASGSGPYWNSAADLANYDFTFAQRIAWKWDAVLAGLREQGWTPPPGPLLDWGCGSGIASRRVIEFFDPSRPSRLLLFDHSSLAMEFAAAAARDRFPDLSVEAVTLPQLGERPFSGTLVVSHVLNELDESGVRTLRQLAERAQAVLWVEPGTFNESRALIEVREALRTCFELVAPCPHQAVCGLRAPGNERHWCHHFAPPPAGIMADSNWVRFGQRAGIDLRSLPYSFLVMERKGVRAQSAQAVGGNPEGWTRVIGQPRVYKGFAKLLSCRAEGVCELELQRRVAPAAFKAFKAGSAPSRWRYKVTGQRIVELNRE